MASTRGALKDAFVESRGSWDPWSEGNGSNGLTGRYLHSILGVAFGSLTLVVGSILLIVSAAEFDQATWVDHKRDSSCTEDLSHDGMWHCSPLSGILDSRYKHHGLTVAGILLVCAGFVAAFLSAAPLVAAGEIMRLKEQAETGKTAEERRKAREEYKFRFDSFNRNVQLLSSAASALHDVQVDPLLPALTLAR